MTKHLRGEVVPWISLGAGYKPPSKDPASGHYNYTIPWDYPIWYSWQIGRDVKNLPCPFRPLNPCSGPGNPPTFWKVLHESLQNLDGAAVRADRAHSGLNGARRSITPRRG
jgi:hypothetical protein